MPIPISSNYPTTFDNDENLFLVHDALRVRLVEDYTPGAASITIEDPNDVMDRFPDSGLITCTEQCSDIDDRAISFFYTSRTATTFDGLILLSEFTDVAKPKKITNVTQNVMARHHNHLKDALIAIQTFVGVRGTTDTSPFGSTLEGRINFLQKLIFTPRAWFTTDKKLGLVPLSVTFKDESFRLGDSTICYLWDFGDDTCSAISIGSCIKPTISVTSVVPLGQRNVLVKDLDGGTIQKTYTQPGIYNVTLTVSNEFGQDTVLFTKLINARVEAPQEAVIDYVPKVSQSNTAGDPIGGPFDTPPTLKSVTNTFIDMEVKTGENPSNLGRSYGGELLNASKSPIDPIIEYTWNLGDDLTHSNQPTARAAYSLGGFYDLVLRVDTQFGAFRITTYENSINIIEKSNLWLWTFSTLATNGSGTAVAQEFGLLSETFKTHNTNLTVTRDNSFLDALGSAPFHATTEARAKEEFSKNTAFVPQGTLGSGDSGTALLLFSNGGADIANQAIEVRGFNAFDETYVTHPSIPTKPWNWATLNSGAELFLLFGTQETITPLGTNLANPIKTTYNTTTLVSSNITLTASDFENGADELLQHVSSFDGTGTPTNGFFNTYRTAWKDNTGYILRNDGVNEFHRIKSFYKTQGNLVDPVQTITKLPDLAGSTKIEGQLVTLTNGVFFFNNSGNISAWNDSTDVWETGAPDLSSVSFRSLQDTTVANFDSASNTLLATSDEDRIAYLSYDYSTKAFIKYNGTDNTFVDTGVRPTGTQFMMGVF